MGIEKDISDITHSSSNALLLLQTLIEEMQLMRGELSKLNGRVEEVASSEEADPPEDDAKEVVENKPAKKPARKPAKKPEPEPEQEEEEDEDPLADDEEDEAEEYTADDVRAALATYRDENGSPAMMKVLKDNDATGMRSLKPEKYASVIKACNA